MTIIVSTGLAAPQARVTPDRDASNEAGVLIV